MMKTIKIGLSFTPENTDKPIITSLVRMGLSCNILKASITQGKQGKMLMEMSGEEDDLDKGIEFLKEHDVTVKLYTENLIHYEEQCVHCGACTAVCPSKALTMNQNTWELEFDMEECLMCGHCVRACPTRAIKLSEEL